jgi:hypothetical protein
MILVAQRSGPVTAAAAGFSSTLSAAWLEFEPPYIPVTFVIDDINPEKLSLALWGEQEPPPAARRGWLIHQDLIDTGYDVSVTVVHPGNDTIH